MQERAYTAFREFYPYYLSEHRDPRCRGLHYVGSGLVLVMLTYTLWTGRWGLFWLLPVIGYGFAWAGHFFFERNRPATFRYPIFSLIGDWVMLGDFLTGRLRARLAALPADDKHTAA